MSHFPRNWEFANFRPHPFQTAVEDWNKIYSCLYWFIADLVCAESTETMGSSKSLSMLYNGHSWTQQALQNASKGYGQSSKGNMEKKDGREELKDIIKMSPHSLGRSKAHQNSIQALKRETKPSKELAYGYLNIVIFIQTVGSAGALASFVTQTS